MPKSRSKKNRDFQKVKLKVGRKLQKADNATNTSFKTRTVQVAQQLKYASPDSGSKRQHNLTDLFIHCRHYNSHVRLDAVDHMKDYFISSPHEIISHLSLVIERISELFVDKDNLVRNANTKLSKFVLPQISVKQMSPFFPLLSAHLTCAMTHIDDDVRLDSLPIFDLILSLYPSLVLNSSSKILLNFIDQISNRKNKPSGSSGKSERSLALDPDSKTSTMKWRANVLNRIQKLLRIVLQHIQEKASQTISSDNSLTVKWTTEGIYVQCFPGFMRNNWDQEKAFSLSMCDSLNKQHNTYVDMDSLVETLLPLLLECWVESSPAKHVHNKSGNALTGSSVSLMFEVVVVLELLLQCLIIPGDSSNKKSITELNEKYLKGIDQHLVQHFPYSVVNSLERKKTSGKTRQQTVSSETFNLSICLIMAHFISDEANREKVFKTWIKKISKYLRNNSMKTKMTQEEIRLLVGVIKRLIEYFDQETLEKIFDTLQDKLQNVSHLSKDRIILLEMLGELSLDNKYADIVSFELRNSFLSSLPNLFCRVVSDSPNSATHLLTLMKKATCQKCNLFLDNLEAQFQNVWDEDVILHLSEEGQRSLIDLMYYINTFSESQLKHIASLCFSLVIPEKTVFHMVSVLNSRFWAKSEDISESVSRMQFLFTLIMGCTSDTLNDLQKIEADSCSTYEINTQEDVEIQIRKRNVTELVCRLLESFPNNYQLADIFSAFVSNILERFSTFPLSALYGLLHCWNMSRKFAENRVVSNNIQRGLVDISFVISDVLIAEQTDLSSKNASTFLMEVWKETQIALSKCTSGWPMFYSDIVNILQDAHEDNINNLIFKIAAPLRDEDTRFLLMNMQLTNQLTAICHTIQNKHRNLESSKIWHEFNHLLSMLC